MVRVALLMFAALGPSDEVALAGLANADVAHRAEEEFQQGVELRPDRDKALPHFRIAADYFDELRRRGARNPELYRNLGNACLLADDLPRAILSYRRGLAQAPTDGDLQAGLTEARGRVVHATTGGFGLPSDDHRLTWLPRLGSETFFAGAALCYVVACCCLTRWLMTRGGRVLAFGVVALAAALGLTVLVVVAVQSEREDRTRPLVVVAEDGVLLRKGDGLAFPPRYETPVNKGVEARRLFERGGWVQMELSGGEAGWVRRDDLLIDEP